MTSARGMTHMHRTVLGIHLTRTIGGWVLPDGSSIRRHPSRKAWLLKEGYSILFTRTLKAAVSAWNTPRSDTFVHLNTTNR